MSAELIAVSSIFTYDVYQTYINPSASGRRLIAMSHTTVVLYAFLLAAFSTALHYIGISMGYLYLLMGVIISAGVLPASLTLLWSQQSWLAATLTPPLGLACSLTAWLVTAKKLSGTLTVDSTGANYPMLAGNVVALLSPVIFVPFLTYVASKPQHYDWQSMKAIRKGDDADIARRASVTLEDLPGERNNSVAEDAEEQRKLSRASKIARSLTLFLSVALLVLWPMPMYGSSYVFSKTFFRGWIVVGILWMFCSAGAVCIYPVWEGRRTIARTTKCAIADLMGKNGRAMARLDAQEGSEPEMVQETVVEKK